MSDLNAALAESRAALEKLIAAGEKSGPAWTTPRAPGEVVAEPDRRARRAGARGIRQEHQGRAERVSVAPGIRPAAHPRLVLQSRVEEERVHQRQDQQGDEPDRGADHAGRRTRTRLQQAHAAFERACKDSRPRFTHGVFGDISTADYARFQALHTLHHTKQIAGA